MFSHLRHDVDTRCHSLTIFTEECISEFLTYIFESQSSVFGV